jgi:hypothetical protein
LSRLTRFAFREAIASRLSWVLIAGSSLLILLILSLGVEGGAPLRAAGEAELYGGDGRPLSGPNPAPGSLTLGFGALRLPLFRDGAAMAAFLQAFLARWVGGAVGTSLALIGAAMLLPESLRTYAVSGLLVKPVPRWLVLAGKSLGALLFVAAQAAFFVVGTWLALGLRTGHWSGGYLLSAPVLVLNVLFAYGVVALLAVTTRSPAVCVLGSIGFWLLCAATNHGRDRMAAMRDVAPEVAHVRALPWTVEAGYWTLPKPIDLAVLLERATETDVPAVGRAGPRPDPGPSIASSLLFTLAVFLVAAREFERLDY